MLFYNVSFRMAKIQVSLLKFAMHTSTTYTCLTIETRLADDQSSSPLSEDTSEAAVGTVVGEISHRRSRLRPFICAPRTLLKNYKWCWQARCSLSQLGLIWLSIVVDSQGLLQNGFLLHQSLLPTTNASVELMVEG